MRRYERSRSKRFAVREAWSGLEDLKQGDEAWDPIGSAFASPPETGTGLASGPSPRPKQDPGGSRSVSRLSTLLPSGAFERLQATGPEPSGNFERFFARGPETPPAAPAPAVIDLAARLGSAAFERPSTPQGPDVLRARFGAAFEAALPSRSGLRSIARCARTWIGRAHACGAESTAIEGFCGSPLCATCAGTRAATASRAARTTWDERVIVARATLGGEDLPGTDAVTAARAAWSKAATAAGVESLPRVVIVPGGLAIYARLSGQDEGRAIASLIEGARAAGLELSARVSWCGEAADDLALAIEGEARAFSRAVADDLARIDDGGDAATITSAWFTRVQARHHDGRRQTILGGKGALEVEGKSNIEVRPPTCPAHGEGCAALAVIVRDDAERRHPATALDGATRQSIAKLID